MQVILLKNVQDVGSKGDVVRVKEGFGRNFLFPQNLALLATKSNKTFVEDLKVRAEKRRELERREARELVSKLEKEKIVLERKSGGQEKLFGSVTNEDLRNALETKNYSFTKKQIQLKEPIRSLGSHAVTIEVYPQIKATLSVEVVSKS